MSNYYNLCRINDESLKRPAWIQQRFPEPAEAVSRILGRADWQVGAPVRSAAGGLWLVIEHGAEAPHPPDIAASPEELTAWRSACGIRLVLCRLTLAEAHHLMMAPVAAGGWIAISSAVCAAVDATIPRAAESGRGYLALIPSDWREAEYRVSAEDAGQIADRLERASEWLPARSGETALEWAQRIREARAQG